VDQTPIAQLPPFPLRYDGEFWSNKNSLMQLYDVGMSSMFAMEAFALSELADVIGRPESAMLRKRGASMQALISAHLWDDETHIFTNKFANGSFYRRISPTSFYAMLANASTDTQGATLGRQPALRPDTTK
jgi:putative isomerase